MSELRGVRMPWPDEVRQAALAALRAHKGNTRLAWRALADGGWEVPYHTVRCWRLKFIRTGVLSRSLAGVEQRDPIEQYRNATASLLQAIASKAYAADADLVKLGAVYAKVMSASELSSRWSEPRPNDDLETEAGAEQVSGRSAGRAAGCSRRETGCSSFGSNSGSPNDAEPGDTSDYPVLTHEERIARLSELLGLGETEGGRPAADSGAE